MINVYIVLTVEGRNTMIVDKTISLGDMLQLIIALVALYMAWIEFQRQKMEKMDTENKRKIIKRVISSVESIKKLPDILSKNEELMNKAMNFLRKYPVDQPEKWDSKALGMTGGMCKEAKNNIDLIRGNDVFEQVSEIYKILVKAEEKFSLSYGYSRYINDMREFIMMKKEFEEVSSNMDELIKKINEGDPFGPNDIVPILNKTCEFLKGFVGKFEIVISHVEELKIKYEESSVV